MNDTYIIAENGELYHHGIKGMRWGVRRFQNEDGSLTSAGKKRYGDGHSLVSTQKRKLPIGTHTDGYEKRNPPVGAMVDGPPEYRIPKGAHTLTENSSLKAAVGGGKVVLGAILATRAYKAINSEWNVSPDFRPEVQMGSRVALGLLGGALGATSVALIGTGVKNIREKSTDRSRDK